MWEGMFLAGGGPAPKPIYKSLLPSEFITGTALATLVGASSLGTAMPEIDSTPWMVFRENSKVYCMPQKPLKHTWPYNGANTAGLIYGKNATIKGGVWKVRTFTGIATNSEWMRMMAGFLAGGTPPIRWANMSYDDLGIGPLNTVNNGCSVYLQETYNQYQYYVRGIRSDYTSLSNNNMGNAFNTTGWRPLLEFVSGSQPWV